MFKKLGIGLSADDKYQRAFEKGVLLGDFGAAARLFEEAARDFEKRGDPEGQTRAMARSKLYEYIKSGDSQLLDPLIDLLRQLPEIERIGTETDVISTEKLVAELEGRKTEAEIKRLGDKASDDALAAAHEQARDKFAALRTEKLLTYTFLSEDPLKETAESRYFYHAAQASWHRARAATAVDPAGAADEMSRAVIAYRRAGYKPGEDTASALLANLRLTRTCWLCGREMQAQGINFEYLPTKVLPYHRSVLEKANQDVSTLAAAESQVAVCVVCKGLIVNQAEAIATEIARQITSEMILPMVEQIDSLTEAVNRLSRIAHSH